MRQLNTQLFLSLLGLGVGLSVALFGVHYLQTGRIARALLWQAEHAGKDQPDQAARYLGRYLEFSPDDVERRAELGRLLADRVLDPNLPPVSYKKREQALFVLEQVVARDPQQQELRRQLARVAMSMNRVDLALEHLRKLEEAQPQDGVVQSLLGQCHEAQEHDGEAVRCYWKAIELAPAERDSYVRLAGLLQRPGRIHWETPDKETAAVLKKSPQAILDLLVERNPQDVQAYLTRWRERGPADLKDPQKREIAAADVYAALKLAPEDVDALLAGADLARSEPDGKGRPQARVYLNKARELHPHEQRVYLTLAGVALDDSKPEEAIDCLKDGLKALPEQPNLLWLLANVCIDHGDRDQARKTLDRLARTDTSPTGLDYVQARLLLQEGRWLEASRLLEKNLPIMERDGAVAPLLNQVDLYLVQCYEQLDEPGRRLEALERIAAREERRDRSSETLFNALRSIGTTLAAQGRVPAALARYEDLLRHPNPPFTAHMERIDLLIRRNLQQVSGGTGQAGVSADWSEVQQALEAANKVRPGALEVRMVEARVLVLQKRYPDAGRVLEEARKQFPQAVEPWVAQAALQELSQDGASVPRLLKEAQTKLGDRVELRLALARYWAAHTDPIVSSGPQAGSNKPAGEPPAGPDRKTGIDPTTFDQGWEKFPRPEQNTLLRGLAEAYHRAGWVKKAEEMWVRLVTLPGQSDDLRLQLGLFDLALQADDLETTDKVLARIKAIEGSQGPLWSYGRALQLLREVGKVAQPKEAKLTGAEEAKLTEVASLLDIAAQRSKWAAVPVARAQLARLRHNDEQQIQEYRKALDLGEHNLNVQRQLVSLLISHNRRDEAYELVKKIPTNELIAADLQFVAADLALHNQDAARATEVAMSLVNQDDKDYRGHLLFAQILEAAGRRREAEQEYQRATKLGPDHPETWMGLVQFLAARDPKAAEKAIQTARKDLPADQAALTLAHCYEALGDRDRAREQYKVALEGKPADMEVLRSVIYYHLRVGETVEAEALFRRILTGGQVKANATDLLWARGGLALLLARRNEQQAFGEALGLVGLQQDRQGNIVKGPEQPGAGSVEEQRYQAEVLAAEPRHACRSQAVTLLEDLNRRHELKADDQFLLARLYEAEDATPRARELLRDLAARKSGVNPAHLVYYAQTLLRQHAQSEAQNVLNQLKALEQRLGAEPGSLGSVALEAEILEARNQPAQALDLVKEFVERRQKAHPEDVFLLVSCMNRQKHFAEALDLCDPAWKTCPAPAVGGLSVAVLRSWRTAGGVSPPAEQVERVRRHLQAEADKDDKGAVFLLHLADLYDLQGKYEEATSFYRKVLQRDPQNVVALNNLAWLLAQKSGDGKEAQELIERAIARLGERAELLDTRAVVALAGGQVDRAIADLERANADNRTPSRCFRLARAYHLAGKEEAARDAFRQARASGLKPEQLHPIEQMAFRKVSAELDQQ